MLDLYDFLCSFHVMLLQDHDRRNDEVYFQVACGAVFYIPIRQFGVVILQTMSKEKRVFLSLLSSTLRLNLFRE